MTSKVYDSFNGSTGGSLLCKAILSSSDTKFQDIADNYVKSNYRQDQGSAEMGMAQSYESMFIAMFVPNHAELDKEDLEKAEAKAWKEFPNKKLAKESRKAWLNTLEGTTISSSEYDKLNQKGLIMLSALELKEKGLINEDAFKEIEGFCQLDYAIVKTNKKAKEEETSDDTD